MALSPQFGSLVPSQVQEVLQDNYLQWTDAAGANFADFAQQYLPEIYEAEVERYGNRTLSGFLRMVGAELPMTSDQVIWSEQNRLHIAYDGLTLAGANVINWTGTPAGVTNVISVGSTVVVMDDFGNEVKCYVSSTVPGGAGVGTITALPYTAATIAAAGLTGTVKVFVYGSEYAKGSTTPNFDATALATANQIISIDPSFTQFSNNPVIIRNKYVVNGSDTAQIGWVEVATEDGTGGYLWYLKAESETRLRFEDYLEMMCIEGEVAAVGSAAVGNGQIGTQGLFAAIEDRGNVQVGFSAASGISDFDDILRNLDTQGAIEENMLFLDRQTALDFDDMLAAISSGSSGGTAYGLFENSEEMALNLGFSGFRRGSYDFYKSDFRYLNDHATRRSINAANAASAIRGVVIPAGTSTVYDQSLGSNIKRPFLHVRYRASQTDDRRMKTWVTGSVGAATSALDAMQLHFLSERCLITQGANNFMLMQ